MAALLLLGAWVAQHISLALGQGYGLALGLGAMQAVAVGVVLWQAGWGRVGAAVGVVLLAGLGLGGLVSPADGVLAAAGLGHAMLYGGLLVVFYRSLRGPGPSIVTVAARRMNPCFHAGMVGYTRGVAWAWCGFFAGQLVASGVLLVVAPQGWRWLVTGLHAPLVLGMAVGEYLVRRWWWRREHYTGFLETIRGMRGMMGE